MTGAGSSSGTAEEEGEEEAVEVDQGITEYERQRLETIKQNEAMLASLQLKDLATTLEHSNAPPSVMPGRKKKSISLAVPECRSGERRRSQRLSSMKTTKVVDWSSDSSEEAVTESEGPKSGGKGKQMTKKRKKIISLAKLDDIEEKKKEDVEYDPSESSDSEEEDEEDESEIEPETEVTRKWQPSRKQTTPVKRPRSRTLKSPVKRTISLNSPELFQKSSAHLPLPVDLDLNGDENDDLALQQALALSMGSTVDAIAPSSSGGIRGKPSPQSPQGQTGSNSASKRRNKRGKSLMYEDSEIDDFFVSIVGNKEGRLSKRHLVKAASAHDFIWKEEEISDMIDMFDADGDGQLNLAEFRSMARRSNLMETC